MNSTDRRHREPVSLVRRDGRRSRLLLFALVLPYLIVVIRTAWMSDDAYISLRTVDNLINGYGLRWNVDERVQSFTHPLWLMVLTAGYAMTKDAYFMPLIVSVSAACAAVSLFATRIAISIPAAIVGVCVFVFSRAFIEYSTSGLENPLTALLLALFLITLGGARARTTTLWLLGALVALNRLDLSLLVAPCLAADTWDKGLRRVFTPALIGLLPLVAWEMFSIVYYGFPFPNTAYAKLQTGIGAGQSLGQGTMYLLDTMATDPVTPLTIFVACCAAVRFDVRRSWPLVGGVCLYCAYIARIGGDFMSGRLLTAPLFVAVVLLARMPWRGDAAMLTAVASIAFLGIFSTDNPPVTSNANTFIPPQQEARIENPNGIADERMYYYRYTGLLRWSRAVPLPNMGAVNEGRALRGTHEVVPVRTAGLTGFFAGANVHLVDVFGLSDPLLARMPARAESRIGHFEREIPAGYLESIRAGENRLEDPVLWPLYRDIRAVTTGPLWSRRRWRAIVRLNF